MRGDEEADGRQEPGPTALVADAAGQDRPRAALVVGVNRDPASDAALAAAVDLGTRLAAQLVVVHAVSLGDYPVDPDAADWEDFARRVLDAERQRVTGALVGYRFGWSYLARHGPPAAVLTAAAAEHDALLIVVGRHGHRRSETIRRLLDGSVSAHLARTAGRPVLVVPIS